MYHHPAWLVRFAAVAQNPSIGDDLESVNEPTQEPVPDLEEHLVDISEEDKPKVRERAQYMTPDEVQTITKRTVKGMVDLVGQIEKATGGVQSFIEAARGGKIKRGWYANYANFVSQLFPNQDDAHRFTAILAASSPRIPVSDNLRVALDVWKEWNEAGRPNFKTRERGLEFMREIRKKWTDQGRSVRYTDPETGHEHILPLGKHVIAAHVPNLISALMYQGDWKEFRLSGPKVDSFYQNLSGNLHRATNDAWMAYFGGIKQAMLGKPWGYATYTSYIRQASHLLNTELPKGEKPWTPAEVQETIWSFFRGLSRLSAKGNLDPTEIVSEITNGDIDDNVDFLTEMFNNDQITFRLKSLGYGKQLERLREGHESLARERSSTFSQRAAPNPSDLLKAVAARAAASNSAFKRKRINNALTGLRLRFENPALIGQGEGSVEFMSPNVDENLTFDQAYSRLHSSNQAAYHEVAKDVLKQANLQAIKSLNAVGDWSDGAENSIVQVLPAADPGLTRYVAAWHGLLLNQKSILHFASDPKGQDSVYQVTIHQPDTAKVRADLSRFGIQYRTIIPGRDSNTVLVYDQGGGLRSNIEAFAEDQDASVRETRGTGELIGASSRNPSRTEARAKYREIIREYEAKTKGQNSPGPATNDSSPTRLAAKVLSRIKRAAQDPFAQPSPGPRKAPEGGMVSRGVTYPGGAFVPNPSPNANIPLDSGSGDVVEEEDVPTADDDEGQVAAPLIEGEPDDHREALLYRASQILSDRNQYVADPQQRKFYLDTLSSVVEKMNPKVHERVRKGSKSFVFYPNVDELTRRTIGSVRLPPDIPINLIKIGGVYRPGDQSIHLDGDFPNKPGTISDNYAHEMAHAADGPDNQLSGTAVWHNIHHTEFGDAQLNKYSSSHPIESFAEFARVVWLKQLPQDIILRNFPRAYRYFKANGLI